MTKTFTVYSVADEPSEHDIDPARTPVFDCHYSDYDGGDPIGYAVNQMEADEILRRHFAPMSAPPLCPLSPHDRDWKGEQVWGYWTASADEEGGNNV